MFIEITTPQNPLRLENTLRPYKRGEQPFTPEAAQQILQSTNHKKNIYDTLQIIASLPKEQQAQYKNIILSAFDHREQPTDTILLGKKLAASHNFEDELNAILTHDPMQDTTGCVIYASAPNQIAAVISADRTIYPSNYPENIHLICANDKVTLCDTNFSTVKSLKFKDGAEVYLSYCQNLPETVDLSMCDNVDLSYTDLSTIKSLRFKEGAEVNLSYCKNLPETLDVSMCDEVDLSETDLSPVKSLKFKEGSAVYLWKSKNLPETIDLSICDKVNLSHTNLSTVKSLKFKEGAEVDLYNSENLPADLDVSLCDQIYLNDSDLSTVKTLKFKNKQQLRDSKAKCPDNWQGNIIYTDNNSPAGISTKHKMSQCMKKIISKMLASQTSRR